MKREDIVTVLMTAKSNPFHIARPVSIPGWDYVRLSTVIGYCVQAGLVHAADITNLLSRHREYRLIGITRAGEGYLKDNT
jgi:hypothetical protein